MAFTKNVAIQHDIHDLVVMALDDYDWEVEKIVTVLANEIKFVVKNYADEVD